MKKIFAILCLLLVVTPVIALAQAATTSTTPCTIGALNSATNKPSELPRCVNQIYIWSLGVAALLALFMMTLGGYYYMTAAGNGERTEKGVEMIWSSIIGLALLFGAYLLLNTINPDLVNFGYIKNDFKGLESNQTNSPTPPPRTP